MERWQLIAEISFDPRDGETTRQAVERVKAALNRMLEREPEINRYHVLRLRRMVPELLPAKK